jgi:hypothetical protein
MRRFALVSGLIAVSSLLSFGVAFAQSPDAESVGPAARPTVMAAPVLPALNEAQPRAAVVQTSSGLPRFGIGVTVGTMGIGVNAGVAVMNRVNVRAGFNAFSYTGSFSKDGADYSATLQLQSVDAKVDLFLLGPFRVTPGVLLYNNNNVDATAAVVGGRSFSLGGTQYFSSFGDPIKGKATLALNKVSPTLAIGFGNMLPHNKHFSVLFDIGVVYQGSPDFRLALSGTGCLISGASNCFPVNSVPGLPANIVNEQNKINHDLNPFKYYPDVTFGFGWRF